jgi:hypothetical protein
VASVTYLDTDGAQQTVDPAIYTLISQVPAGDEPYLLLASGEQWPATNGQPNNITMTVVAGYGDASAVPSPIKSAMHIMLSQLYSSSRTGNAVAYELQDKVFNDLLRGYMRAWV